ncbi:hypothetical protein DGG96_03600 [Legionella qingyii]|uniref:Uncharacterized protein n=1 Tax=Legionella qingyii TaxID=2184757 RepID=A0A317U503_9GAMM|nr:hypothetical protein DGG96_03600 [Legionella qingyii]
MSNNGLCPPSEIAKVSLVVPHLIMGVRVNDVVMDMGNVMVIGDNGFDLVVSGVGDGNGVISERETRVIDALRIGARIKVVSVITMGWLSGD